MAATVLRIPITNVYMGGDYTGTISVGSERKPANVILDTGSSTLALDGKFYDPEQDPDAAKTRIAQEVVYGSGQWIGAVVLTDIGIGSDASQTVLKKVNAAVAYLESQDMFGEANGILGLAYSKLNNAFSMPDLTWPPQYKYNQIQNGYVTYLNPYFSQLEEAGIVANKFAFYTQRSMISNATADPVSDPLNGGYLILGGGEESTDLYSGTFQSARILDDEYYNTNLKAIIVGASDPITVPPPTKGSGLASNSIVDSGTNSLMLNQELFNTVVERFSKGYSRDLVHAMRSGYLAMSNLKLTLWPDLTFILEGDAGDVRLTVKPENYWQINAPERGQATAPLFGDNGQLGGQSILGLPLMNGYFTIFDRSVDKGLGAIQFAARK
jgi:Eukaryotic aspartyl protease